MEHRSFLSKADFASLQQHWSNVAKTWNQPILTLFRPRSWSRPLSALAAFLILSFIVIIILYTRPANSPYDSGIVLPVDTTPTHARTYPAAVVSFWTTFAHHLETARPRCKPIEVNGDMDIGRAKFEPMYHRKPRIDYITLDETDFYDLRDPHRYMADISRKMAKQIPYQRNTRGIVTAAGGGRYFGPLVVSLRMLRRTGSKLPVEVFLSSWAEYDQQLCEHILPQLNAKCRILSDMFSLTPALDIVSDYQYKVFAILFSSFEDVFFLDADSFPVINPDPVMTIDPFKSLGLVTWPDMWAQTSSKWFFAIAGVPCPPVNRFSTDGGQILYSKRKHGASLLLATYYNYYGPDYYYRLQSQNAWGQGDKETFLHAALALNMPFYDVKTALWNVGQWESESNFRHVGMAQYHPGDEYSLSQGMVNAGHKIRPFVMHNNYPWKLDPQRIMEEEPPTRHPNGSYWRLWGTKEDIIESLGDT